MSIKREVFRWDFAESNLIPDCYEKLLFKNSNYTIPNGVNGYSQPYPVICIAMFPKYFDVQLANPKEYKIKKVLHPGYVSASINMTSFTFKTYREFLGKSTLSSINRRIKKLESNFNIEYRMYCGEISKPKYDFLMQWLIDMKNKRLKKLDQENRVLSDFKNYKKRAFDLINQKKASLFVVYCNNEPIGISFNFHMDKMFFGTMTAFDMDYSRFGIGNILLFKQLEWCFDNGFSVVDMGVGSIDYKSKWADIIYNFEYHIIYRRKSPVAFIIAHVEIVKIHMKNLIKKLTNFTQKNLNHESVKMDRFKVKYKFL